MTVHIRASHLIAGDTTPTRDGVVVVEGADIAFAGPAAEAPETREAQVVDAGTVMPGLWDCHTHFMGLAEGIVHLEA